MTVVTTPAAWHGCVEHNHNHCPDCQTCDCHRRDIAARAYTLPRTDEAAIRTILNAAAAAGFKVRAVNDGEDEYPVADVDAAIKHVMDVDAAHVFFTASNGGHPWVWFVLGNEPYEVAADFSEGLFDALDPVIDAWIALS